MKKPKVSVIIPNRNYEHYVGLSIESILNQTWKDFELIVIDDGSTDKSWQVIKRYKKHSNVRCFRQKSGGLARAMNNGLSKAKGSFIGYCGSDDLWEPNFLETLVPIIEKDERMGMVFSDALIIDGKGIVIGKSLLREFKNVLPSDLTPKSIYRSMLQSCCYSHFWLIRRECHEKLGYWNTKFSYMHDYDVGLRIVAHFPAVFYNKPLARFRVHGKNWSLVNVDRRRWLKDGVKLLTEHQLTDESLSPVKNFQLATYLYCLGDLESKQRNYKKALIYWMKFIKPALLSLNQENTKLYWRKLWEKVGKR